MSRPCTKHSVGAISRVRQPIASKSHALPQQHTTPLSLVSTVGETNHQSFGPLAIFRQDVTRSFGSRSVCKGRKSRDPDNDQNMT